MSLDIQEQNSSKILDSKNKLNKLQNNNKKKICKEILFNYLLELIKNI